MKIIPEVETTLREIIEFGDIVRTVHGYDFKNFLDYVVVNTNMYRDIVFCRNMMTNELEYFSENELIIVKKYTL